MRSKKNRKPQVRKRTKPTVGQAEWVDVVYMDRRKVDGVYQIYAACTCDQWESSPEATTITKVAREAKTHVDGGRCQLRFHDPVEVTEGDLETIRGEN